MNLNHTGQAHIIPAVTVLLFVKVHVYFKEIMQYTHSRYFEIWFSLTKLKLGFNLINASASFMESA